MDDSTFEKLADATLKDLMQVIEDALPDAIEDIDLQGTVLTIELVEGGTFVVNKHAANKEIWLSSPQSGAAHFGFDAASGQWISTRGGANLHARLGAELGDIAGASLTLHPVKLVG